MNTMIEMYDRIMSVVEEVTGISKDKILTSNCEECVDARHILVYILGNRSFSDNKIAELTGLTRPGVCIIRNNFKYRRKRYFVNLIFAGVITTAPTLTVGETLESAANVKCNGNVHGYNLLTPVTIAFAATASEEETPSVAVANSKK